MGRGSGGRGMLVDSGGTKRAGSRGGWVEEDAFENEADAGTR